jgi:5-methylcytosine-specific restriction protein A
MTEQTPFVVGATYGRRKDIHAKFGGQQQGGISTPVGEPFVFLFTGEGGHAFGYRDEFRDDGTFWYTGEGQVGDMKMIAGNLAIRDHAAAGKSLEMFERMDGRGTVRYMGRATYLGHHLEERPDRNRAPRQAIVFELALEKPEAGVTAGGSQLPPISPSDRAWWNLSLEELRRRAKQRIGRAASAAERRVVTYQRSQAIKVYVLKRAAGCCEGCRANAPFLTKKGQPFLEPHHIWRRSDGGPDVPEAVIGLCPNCHRRIHYGADGDGYNRTLAERMRELESNA